MPRTHALLPHQRPRTPSSPPPSPAAPGSARPRTACSTSSLAVCQSLDRACGTTEQVEGDVRCVPVLGQGLYRQVGEGMRWWVVFCDCCVTVPPHYQRPPHLHH